MTLGITAKVAPKAACHPGLDPGSMAGLPPPVPVARWTLGQARGDKCTNGRAGDVET